MICQDQLLSGVRGRFLFRQVLYNSFFKIMGASYRSHSG
jgi:hypothetical protein